MQAHIHVVPEFLPVYRKGNIGVSPNTVIDCFNVFGVPPPLLKDLAPLSIGQETEAEATAAAIRPAFVFNDFVSILINIDALYIRVANEFMKAAVANTTHTAVAVNEYFCRNSFCVRCFFERLEPFHGADFGAGNHLSGAIALVFVDLSRSLNVASDAGMDDQMREIISHHLHDRRRLDDHSFRSPLRVFSDLAHHHHELVIGDFGIDGNTDSPPERPGNLNGLTNLRILHLPHTLPAAESLATHIDRIGAPGENLLNHGQASTWC